MIGGPIVAVLGALGLPQIAPAPVPPTGQNSPPPISSRAVDETQTPGALPIGSNQYAASRPPKNPHARLFRPREASPQVGGIRRTDPKIVCGLVLWNADPLIDPVMARPQPDITAQPKVRRIEPAVCRDEPTPAR
jgi:hypothetical protein